MAVVVVALLGAGRYTTVGHLPIHNHNRHYLLRPLLEAKPISIIIISSLIVSKDDHHITALKTDAYVSPCLYKIMN